jgi:hypothetical protein
MPDDTDALASLPSDAELLLAARAGSAAARAALRGRHLEVVRAVAEVHDLSADRVEEAFEALESDAPGRDGPEAVRPQVLALLTGGRYGPAPPGATFDAPGGLAPPDSTTSAERSHLAVAFARLTPTRQAVLWHQLVDREPAVSTATIVGRAAGDVASMRAAAEASLFDEYLGAERGRGTVDGGCAPVVAVLGAYRRGALPAERVRAVEEHLGPAVGRVDSDDAPAGCASCRRRLMLADRLEEFLPAAIAPGVTGLDLHRYRTAIGAGVVAMGSATLAARRSDRSQRLARIAAVVAVVAALLAAAFLIRPLGDFGGEFADLLERAATSTAPPPPSTTGPGDQPGAVAEEPSRIELVFPGVPQGVAYVPGGPSARLGLALSMPAPAYRNGTVTVDATIVNQAATGSTVRFVVRPSDGVRFDTLASDRGRCDPSGAGAGCTVDIAAGATATMSLRLSIAASVPDRLVVVSSIRSATLDVPVESVPGLLVGTVSSGDLLVTQASWEACTEAPCPDGGVVASPLELPAGARVEQAVLRMDGDAADWGGEIGVVVAGTTTTVRSSPSDPGVFDVTASVRRTGGGTIGVIRPAEVTAAGSWSLVVVASVPDAPRRLIVAVAPESSTQDAAVATVVPIESPTQQPPRSPTRQGTLTVTPGDTDVTVVTVDGEAAVRSTVTGDGTYALVIDSASSALRVEVTSDARPVTVGVIGFALDVVT